MLINLDFLENWNFNILLPSDVRSKKNRSAYQTFKKELKEKNISIDKYVLDKYLNSKIYSLNLNKFPYNIPNNMLHYVLWIHPHYFKKCTNKLICEIIVKKMKELNYNEYFCFENQKGCKSVLNISHYQVFYRRC